MKKNRLRKGFSLAEALMTLLLITVVVFLSAPLLMKKTYKKQELAHGIWECTVNGTVHYETKRKRDGTIVSDKKNTGSSCTFIPPLYSKDFSVDICGGLPSTAACKEENGTHTFMFYTSLVPVKNIRFTSDAVYFGKYAFAYRNGDGGRVLVIY